MALATAGAVGGSPGSPRPVGGSSDGTVTRVCDWSATIPGVGIAGVGSVAACAYEGTDVGESASDGGSGDLGRCRDLGQFDFSLSRRSASGISERVSGAIETWAVGGLADGPRGGLLGRGGGALAGAVAGYDGQRVFGGSPGEDAGAAY